MYHIVVAISINRQSILNLVVGFLVPRYISRVNFLLLFIVVADLERETYVLCIVFLIILMLLLLVSYIYTIFDFVILCTV